MLFKINVTAQDAAEYNLSGNLFVDLYGTSVGVYQYTNPDGQVVNHYKSIDEIARPESLRSILGCVLTVHHPPEFQNPNNFKTLVRDGYIIGAFVEPGTMDGRRVKTRAIIWDQATIDAILSGELTEISMGYWHQVESTSGNFEGIEYTVKQTWLYYNHGSLYEPGGGRLGASVGVAMDGKDQFFTTERKPGQTIKTTDSKKGGSFMLIDFGGKSIDIPDNVAGDVKAFLGAQDSKIKGLESDKTTIQAQLDTIKQIQTQDEASKAQDKIEALALERSELMDSAKRVLPETYSFTGKTNTRIRLDALDVLGVKISEDAKASEIAVKASFDSALSLSQSTQSTDSKPTAAQRAHQQLAQDSAPGSTAGGFVPDRELFQGTDSDFMEALYHANKKGAKA